MCSGSSKRKGVTSQNVACGAFVSFLSSWHHPLAHLSTLEHLPPQDLIYMAVMATSGMIEGRVTKGWSSGSWAKGCLFDAECPPNAGYEPIRCHPKISAYEALVFIIKGLVWFTSTSFFAGLSLYSRWKWNSRYQYCSQSVLLFSNIGKDFFSFVWSPMCLLFSERKLEQVRKRRNL